MQKENNTDLQFKRYLMTSLVLHLGVIFFLAVKNWIFTDEDVIIKNAIIVDMVGLPDKVDDTKPVKIAEKKEPEKAPPPRPKPKPKVDKKVQDKAFQKLEELDAFRKLQQKQKEEKEAKQKEAEQEALKKLAELNKTNKNDNEKKEETVQLKGNVITDGTGLKGLDKIQMERYYESVRRHVQSQFEIPTFLSNAQLKAQADIKIDGRGYVVYRGIALSSSNNIFDEAVLSAIDKASPFPEPPSRLQSRLENSGFRLGFPE